MFAQQNIILTRLFSRTRRCGASRFVHGDRRSTCKGFYRYIRASAVLGAAYRPCEVQNNKAPRFRKRIDFSAVHVASHFPISAIHCAVRYWRTAESYLSTARIQCDQHEVNADQTTKVCTKHGCCRNERWRTRTSGKHAGQWYRGGRLRRLFTQRIVRRSGRTARHI